MFLGNNITEFYTLKISVGIGKSAIHLDIDLFIPIWNWLSFIFRMDLGFREEGREVTVFFDYPF